MNSTKEKKADYISHHLPTYRVADNLDDKDSKKNDVLRFSTSENPKSSKGMATSRIVAAVIITLGHVISLYAIYDMMFNLSGWMAFKWFLAAFLTYILTGTMGITAGVHRLWSHRSYKAKFPARLILAFMNTIANQGSIIHWSLEHRVHHIHVDTDADPHNINRGFFYAHMGWLFSPRTDAFIEARKTVDLSDLYADPICYYQDKYYVYLSMFFCYVFPSIIGHYVAGDALRGFLYLGVLRWILLLHATWNVNSVAHTWGTRPYRPEEKATEFAPVSFFSGGEGWHNYHHAFPWDYAASESRADVYWRFNLARFWIDSFAALGWVYDRKVMRNASGKPLTEVTEADAIPATMRDHVSTH